MRRTKPLITLAIAAICAVAPPASAQEATEVFIPVGKSPGLSGETTLIGRVQTVDRQNNTITVVNESGTHVIKIGENTRIWIDRSKVKRTNEYGNMSDCRRGRTCEVKYQAPEKRETAEWIKIQLEP